jgi:hypothetical protein
MKLINCTPHAIVIHTEGGVITLPPSGNVARLGVGPTPDVRKLVDDEGRAIRVTLPPSYEGIEGVPPYDPESAIVVSAMVGVCAPTLLGNKWQGRVYGPDTGKDAVRNEAGHIVGVKGLILYW